MCVTLADRNECIFTVVYRLLHSYRIARCDSCAAPWFHAVNALPSVMQWYRKQCWTCGLWPAFEFFAHAEATTCVEFFALYFFVWKRYEFIPCCRPRVCRSITRTDAECTKRIKYQIACCVQDNCFVVCWWWNLKPMSFASIFSFQRNQWSPYVRRKTEDPRDGIQSGKIWSN